MDNERMEEAPMQVDNNNMMNDDNDDNDEDELDDTPLFLGDGDAVEVQVDDTNIPMDDDDDDDGVDAEQQQQDQEPIVDMAALTITSHVDAVYAVASSLAADGSALRIVSGGGDDKAYWHDLSLAAQQQQQSPQLQTTPLEPHYKFKDSVSSISSNAPFVAFDATKPPNPEWMAVGDLDGSIVLYGPGGKVLPLEGPSSDIEWTCWHPKGGNVLLVGSTDATIWMFHTSLNKCLQVFVGHEDAVTCGSFSADGKVALSASADGTLRIWAPKTGKSRHVFRFEASTGGGPPPVLTCMAIQKGPGAMEGEQQLVMVGGDDGQAHICHVANKKHITSLRHYDPTTHLQDTNNNTVIQDEDGEDEVMLPSGVEAVGFCNSNPNWCATGGMDGVLKIWDLANQGQCRHACFLALPQNNGNDATTTTTTAPTTTKVSQGDGITQLTWHPTLPLVFTSTCRGQIHLWDARNGQRIHTLTGHADVINDMDVSFSDSSNSGGAGKAVIVTASDDKTVKIFHLDIDALLQQQQQQAPVLQQQQPTS